MHWKWLKVKLPHSFVSWVLQYNKLILWQLYHLLSLNILHFRIKFNYVEDKYWCAKGEIAS